MHAGGFEQFRQTYPHLCSADDDTAPCLEVGRLSLVDSTAVDDQPVAERRSLRELITSSPPTLIAPYLYIGNAQNALDIDCLRTNGIQYIVNVTNNVPNRSVRHRGALYHYFLARDSIEHMLSALLLSPVRRPVCPSVNSVTRVDQ